MQQPAPTPVRISFRPDICVAAELSSTATYPKKDALKTQGCGTMRRTEASATMNSRQLAGLIGPTLIALGATEALNIHMFENQIAPVVYLDGTILFVVGVALIRAHNRWAWKWQTFITVIGWVLLAGGLYRMIAPEAPQAHANAGSYAMFAAIVAIGLFLSYKGYSADAPQTHVPN
jgi:hypothetical protein